MAPRWVQVATETPNDVPKNPKSFQKQKGGQLIIAFSPFRFRWAPEASRWLQYDPRDPQEGPKRAPRGAQERPKRAPRGSFEGSDGGRLKESTPFLIDSLQDCPRRASNADKRAPREPQERPKSAPRQPKEGPIGFQNVPKSWTYCLPGGPGV